MKIVDCWIVYHRNMPVSVFINNESAYQFIESFGQVNPVEWQIFKSKLRLPNPDRAIAGQ